MASQSDITISSLREHLRRASNAPLLPIARGIVGDLRRWPFFHSLPLAFAKTIRICSVFGEKGSEVLCVTADDEVWTLGANTYGRLGTGNTTPASTLIKIPELCGKAIQSFAHGAKHTLAVTKKGEVYGWGRNDNSQVGKADPVEIFTPTLVYNGEDPALEIACGHFHSACRTREGAVYCWGDNSRRQLGIGSDRMPQAIRKVERSIGNLKCIGISCGANSTVALFENGEVYSWGLNGTRQVTRDPEEDEDSEDDTDEEEEGGVYQDSPKKVDLGNTIICKIACGDWHTVALADDGALHVWGKNDRFQLGMDDTTDRTTPCLHSNLRDTYGVVLDIAACGSTSAVMTYESKVLMWGSGAEGVVKVPTAIPGDSVQDVFAAWTKVSVTPVPLVVAPFSTTDSETQEPNCAPGWEGNLANTVAENFNNPTCSDVNFAVGNETIHAHRAVLCFQSEYFRNMFEGASIDSGDTIQVSEFSYPVYEAFLRYFYTGEVNLSATECLELLDLAKTCSDSVLETKCQRRIKVMVSVENCASVYAAALRCGAKELEDFCFRFALDNLAAVTQTPAFAELPDHVFRTFYAEVAKHGVFNK